MTEATKLKKKQLSKKLAKVFQFHFSLLGQFLLNFEACVKHLNGPLFHDAALAHMKTASDQGLHRYCGKCFMVLHIFNIQKIFKETFEQVMYGYSTCC